jgi:hypothetical protein
MGINTSITKQQEREIMLEIQRTRETASPCHPDPNWMHDFWSGRLSDHAEIKRVLGVGVATMSDHLRLYIDPFEP